MDDRPVPPLSYLLECSQVSLRNFRLAKLNKSANIRKELKRLMNDWIEERALELLAGWIEEYGVEILALAPSQPEVEEVKADETKPLTPIRSYSEWRSERRHWRKRAG